MSTDRTLEEKIKNLIKDYEALEKTGVYRDQQKLIAVQLDKAIKEHKEPEEIKQGIYKLGELYEKLGNSEKALEKYRQAAELNDVNANKKLAQIYEKGHLGQQADRSKAAQYYFQIGNIYFSQGESQRQGYLKEKNYVENYQNKDKIKKLEKELESTEGRRELLANDYFKKAFILEPKVIEEHLSILENQKKMTQLDAIKNVLQSLSSQEVNASVGSAAAKKVGELVQEIDNKMIVLQVNKVCSGLHLSADYVDPEWMTKLLTLENEVKKRNITDSKILGSIHSRLTDAFSLWEGKEKEKRQEGKYKIDSSLDKSRTKWNQYFHSMLGTRYSLPANTNTPVTNRIIEMLEGKKKNGLSARLALYDFYTVELKFVTKLDPQSDKINMLNKKLVDLADEILTAIPKLNKSEKKQLQTKGYDTTKLRQECLQTLRNVSVEKEKSIAQKRPATSYTSSTPSLRERMFALFDGKGARLKRKVKAKQKAEYDRDPDTLGHDDNNSSKVTKDHVTGEKIEKPALVISQAQQPENNQLSDSEFLERLKTKLNDIPFWQEQQSQISGGIQVLHNNKKVRVPTGVGKMMILLDPGRDPHKKIGELLSESEKIGKIQEIAEIARKRISTKNFLGLHINILSRKNPTRELYENLMQSKHDGLSVVEHSEQIKVNKKK